MFTVTSRWLKEARSELGIIARQACYNAGVSLNTWQAWESGRNAIPTYAFSFIVANRVAVMADLIPTALLEEMHRMPPDYHLLTMHKHEREEKTRDGDWLRGYREELGLSQKHFSEMIQISRRTYQHWEHGDRRIPKFVKSLFLHARAKVMADNGVLHTTIKKELFHIKLFSQQVEYKEVDHILNKDQLHLPVLSTSNPSSILYSNPNDPDHKSYQYNPQPQK